MEGVLYCKPHFEQLFKQTGSFAAKLREIKFSFPGSKHYQLILPHFYNFGLIYIYIFSPFIYGCCTAAKKQNALVYISSFLLPLFAWFLSLHVGLRMHIVLFAIRLCMFSTICRQGLPANFPASFLEPKTNVHLARKPCTH